MNNGTWSSTVVSVQIGRGRACTKSMLPAPSLHYFGRRVYPEVCSSCKGIGHHRKYTDNGQGFWFESCVICHGRGRTYRNRPLGRPI
jgi:hypothetical protein